MPDAEELLLLKRLQYINVKDKGYKWPLFLLIICIPIFITLCILNLNIYGFFALLTGILAAPGYYIIKTRYCDSCKQKMKRFSYETEVYFCCDDCQTKFKSIIGMDSGSSD